MQPQYPNKYHRNEQDWLKLKESHCSHRVCAILVGQEPCSDTAGFVAVSPARCFSSISCAARSNEA